MRNSGITVLLLVMGLVAAPLLAADTISRGIDTFTTTKDGSTFYDFSKNPIPAGFFCPGSAAFTGRIAFKGLPLATSVPGALHGRDTVIERLDDATFDASGAATTRLRFRALSMVSLEPLKTTCGSFNVFVSLAPNQRTTLMHIYRVNELGGTFVAPLAVDVKMSFQPVRGVAGKNLELVGSFTFPAVAIPWATSTPAGTSKVGSVVVDTNGDRIPDASLGGSTGFNAGWTPGAVATNLAGCTVCEPPECHIDPATGKSHCTGGLVACGNYQCP
ncbi:MAG: hypothetical protein U0002_21090 [Thermoanaerobaculia bacterium]